MHIDELGDEAEAIGASLMATVDGVDRYQEDVVNSGYTWTNPERGERDPAAARYWSWDAGVVLAEDTELSPQETAQRMAETLESSKSGWRLEESTLLEAGGAYDLYRPADQGDGEWHVEISFTRKAPPAPQILNVGVISPTTSNRSESEKVEQRDAARATRPEPALAAPRSNRSGMFPDGTFDANRFR